MWMAIGTAVFGLLPARAALPPGWSEADVHSPAQPGSASFADGTWTISGGGADQCQNDQLHFVWKGLKGDWSITTKVETVQNTPNGQGGIMVRNDLTSGIQVGVMATAQSGITFQWRVNTGDPCSYQVVVGMPNLGAPVWLSLNRSGNSFSAYWSTNEADWYQLGSTQTLGLNSDVLAGLAVCANDASGLCTATFSELTFPAPAFGMYRELWTGLNPAAPNSLAMLTNSTWNPNWPANPSADYTVVYSEFETEADTGLTHYGQRLRGFVIPPADGDYTFWIASDNTSELYLGSGERPETMTRIAWVNTATNPREWTRETNQQSAPIRLQAGRRYYLEGRMQQSTGSDNLAVRWQLPNGIFEEPLTAFGAAGTWLIPCLDLETVPGIYLQPTNVIVSDGVDAVFCLLVTNQCPVTYQWSRNGSMISGATNPVYIVARANPWLDNNSSYSCVVSDGAGSVTSASATLTVIADTTPPTVVRSMYLDADHAQIVFSEPIEPATATNTANFVFTNGLAVTQATLELDNSTVTLTTSPMTLWSNYVVVLNGIRDRASSPNMIAANTRVDLFAGPYSPQAIGNPTPPGEIQGTGDGFDLSGGGNDIGGTGDQFQFAWQVRTGDFDIKVRIRSLTQTDAYASAGLMAREDFTPSSRFAAVQSTPTIAGSFFERRAIAGTASSSSGSLPVNYPDTWLRLQRSGDQFAGYASYDGVIWQELGSATMTLSNQLYVGMAVCSHDPAQLAVAEFRDLADVTNAITGEISLPDEPLGPSSRRTGLTISEIMYHPASRSDGRDLEYIELFNSQPFFEDISGYSISGDVSFTFPAGTVLGAGAYLVVAAAPADVQAVYGINNVTGPYNKKLSNSSGTVRLRNQIGAILLEVNYDSKPPWPAAADGGGHSLVLVRPSYGEGNRLAWRASDRKGGSPGSTDGYGPDPARGVVINEFLAHTDLPLLDTIELFNKTTQTIDLSGCYLTDDPQTNKFRMPNGIHIGGRSFLALDERQLGFRLDAAGETLYLVNALNTRVLDAVRFEGQANGVSSGRYPDGAGTIRALASRTLGTNNSPPLSPAIVINELMYDSISGLDDDQYVELYSKSAARVDLSGWKFTAGIDYEFPPNTTIAAGGYLVIARNASRLLTHYPNLNSGNLVGDFSKSLSGRGERVALSMPHDLVSTNSQGAVVTNTIYIVVNEVTYGTGGRWGEWSDRGGSSLELIDPHSDNSLAPNWAPSDETAKASWTTVEFTGVCDLGNYSSPDQLQLFLQGAGECLVDNVEVFRSGEGNRITNPNFDSGSSGWYFQGTQSHSTIDTSGGYGGGGPCLHLRATARGDTGANRIRTVLSSPLASGNTVTLRAKARWLKGNPELLLRLHGNWLEAAGRLTVPANLGTPGGRNSRYTANAGPAIVEVRHTPVLPAAGEPVVVTARVSDPDGVGAVQLVYRNDSAGSPPVTVNMMDNATGGDEFAGDGIYSATVPGQSSGILIAFHVEATDAAASPAGSRFPDDAPTRECLARFGEIVPPGTFGTYRTWVTRANVNTWTAREKNSNDPLDATFVYGDFRAVYNVKTLYSGSPFHTGGYTGPTGSQCDYVLQFPDDDRMLGANDFVMATIGNLGNDDTAQREQAAFWMLRELGVPSLHRRHVFFYVNGIRRGPAIMEDSQQPSSDVVDEYFPEDANGHLHKIEDWFEFDNSGSGFANVDATLDNFTTTGGVKKMARYRWNWRPRAVQNSANEFDDLYALVDALHTARPEPYTREVEALVDVDEWMRVFALERFVCNWDSFSYSRGKNMYAYKPEHGPWQMLPWDIDFVAGLGSDGTETSLFGGQDSSVNTMRSHPPFQRAYCRAYQDLLDGPLQSSRIDPMLDAKYKALRANGISVNSPLGVRSWLSNRRNYVQNQLSAVGAAFNISSVNVRNNTAVLAGTAPVRVKTIWFNGNAYPVTWSGLTTWTATVPLAPGVNPISVIGTGSSGQAVVGASNYVTATYSGTVPSPAGQVVINEIMYNPAAPNAEYVELYNNSSTITFDLSGWEFNGLSYTFSPGSLIGPTNYLVLAADRFGFASAYGISTPVFDCYDGRLQGNGETLTLLRPETDTVPQLTVAKVRYDGGAPWPKTAQGTGSSLQLIDTSRDNWRAGNWTAIEPNSTAPAQWVYVTATGTASSSTLYIYLQSAGDIYLDDIQLVAGSVPEAGVNRLDDGDFESGFPGPWNVSANLAGSALSTTIKRSGGGGLHLVASSGGTTQGSSIWQSISPGLNSGKTYTLSFWYLQSTNGGPLILRLSYSGIYSSVDPAPPGNNLLPATPGAINSVAASLPAFPSLWINELEAENLTGITNRAGQQTAWLELYNPGTSTVDLSGLYLANNYTNLNLWPFPAGASINPGQFKVIFADGLSGLSTLTELHTSFALSPGAGTVALSRIYNGEAQVLDYVAYTNLPANRSYGSFRDGQSFTRAEFFYPTPGGTNNNASPPLTVGINEWMADNKASLADPADGDYEDWFELYNPGTNSVDLGGFYLTDNLTNKFEFEIPGIGQYVIPPKGFLLVWADGETGQNSPTRPDLHVSFKLDKAGEAIGLFGSDGTPVDYVIFGAQMTDVAMGRYPDGGSSISFLPYATPRAPNPAPNLPPTLTPIPDRILTLGQSLSFIVSASDPDQPSQSLTFGLGPGAPAAAFLDPVSGQFAWTPTMAPSTNDLTITVSDSGEPVLTASTSFRVMVFLPPQIQKLRLIEGQVSFGFQTSPGVTYQLESCDDLADQDWTPIDAPFTGTGEIITLSEEIGSDPHRFFRLRVLQ